MIYLQHCWENKHKKNLSRQFNTLLNSQICYSWKTNLLLRTKYDSFKSFKRAELFEGDKVKPFANMTFIRQVVARLTASCKCIAASNTNELPATSVQTWIMLSVPKACFRALVSCWFWICSVLSYIFCLSRFCTLYIYFLCG